LDSRSNSAVEFSWGEGMVKTRPVQLERIGHVSLRLGVEFYERSATGKANFTGISVIELQTDLHHTRGRS